MTSDDFDQPPQAVHAAENKPSFWKKLGGGSLSISLIVHAILLSIGLVWIFQVIPDKVPDPDFMPKGGGGGSPGVKEISNKKQRATMSTPNTPRMAAKGATSSFALPEPDAASAMSSVGSLSSGGLSGGLGGSGSGGGRGDGQGKGFGSGMGPGLGGGNASGMSPFGMIDPNANALVGTFYNIDRRSDGNELKTDNPRQWDIINDFVTRGWKDASLAKYQASPKKLYQTRIYMPAMNAAEAPKAFGMTPDEHPRWMVVYRGTIIPPKTGKYRFVGAGDDTMVVRFNNRNIFDFGFISGTVRHETFLAALKDPKQRNALRGCPMEAPVTFYQYPTTGNWNSQIGGCAVGPEFEVQAGKEYPIDILICEGWGGLFAASLMIEEVGATYQKSSSGSPILPLFRTDGTLPGKLNGDNQPPYDPQGSIWTVSKRTAIGGI
ncbi:hypothetical protein KBB96_07245 [Luteolibacter ambystomatis]|uniref:PA14 domain-containing protein n=1 Tax=Luteolibacter ambystomatis TaxID=2824561 RepID=A0A975J2A6_9BACT|nr:hypothetical protein [Luteolibacter ambystomatis]QUE52682.1 hypothetical protein KBB96_07245 [Luteolibacter ambystomatis]